MYLTTHPKRTSVWLVCCAQKCVRRKRVRGEASCCCVCQYVCVCSLYEFPYAPNSTPQAHLRVARVLCAEMREAHEGARGALVLLCMSVCMCVCSPYEFPYAPNSTPQAHLRVARALCVDMREAHEGARGGLVLYSLCEFLVTQLHTPSAPPCGLCAVRINARGARGCEGGPRAVFTL
jgi:hypothetical protein